MNVKHLPPRIAEYLRKAGKIQWLKVSAFRTFHFTYGYIERKIEEQRRYEILAGENPKHWKESE